MQKPRSIATPAYNDQDDSPFQTVENTALTARPTTSLSALRGGSRAESHADFGTTTLTRITASSPIVESTPAAARPTSKIYQAINDGAVFVYKIAGVVVLATLMLWTISYLALTTFYLISTQWIAPFIASPGQERVIRESLAYRDHLRILEQLRERLQADKSDLNHNQQVAESLENEFEISIDALVDQIEETELKRKLVNPRIKRYADFEVERKKIARDHQNHLITSEQMQKQLDSLAKEQIDFRRGATSTSSSSVQAFLSAYDTSHDKDKLLSDLLSVNLDSQSSRTVREMLRINTSIKQAKTQMERLASREKETSQQIAFYEPYLKTMEHSPFVLASKQKVPMAFVPYDNLKRIVPGQQNPIYACRFYFINCVQIGNIKEVLDGEVTFTHPFFNSPVRGVFVRTELNQVTHGENLLMVLDRPPLGW